MAAHLMSPPSSIPRSTAPLMSAMNLLLAREAVTVISRKRVEGAHRLVKEGVDLIIMDDGFQSARLTLDYALVVIDTVRGIGNGHLVPGGPVRAPLAEQMRHMTGLLKVGNGHAADPLVRTAAKAAKPVFVAAIKPQEPQDFRGRRVLAYAGIADPAKFSNCRGAWWRNRAAALLS